MGAGQEGRCIVAIKTKIGILVSFASKGIEIFRGISRRWMVRLKLFKRLRWFQVLEIDECSGVQ